MARQQDCEAYAFTREGDVAAQALVPQASQANAALDDLRAGRFSGAAVLLP